MPSAISVDAKTQLARTSLPMDSESKAMPQERPVASPLSGNDWHDVNGRNAKRHMTTVVTSSAPTQHNLGEMEREGTQQRAQLSSYTGRTLQERALTDIRDNV